MSGNKKNAAGDITMSTMDEWWDQFGSQLPNPEHQRLTGFMLFAKVIRPIVKEENPDLTFGQIGKEMGRRWQALTEEEKHQYKFPTTFKPYQKLKQAGKNGDLETIKRVVMAHKQQAQEEENSGSTEEKNQQPTTRAHIKLCQVLYFALNLLHPVGTRRCNKKAVMASSFAEYLIHSLHDAAEYGRAEICKYILFDEEESIIGDLGNLWEGGREILWSKEFAPKRHLVTPELHHPLIVAAKKGHSDIVQILLSPESAVATSLVKKFWKVFHSTVWEEQDTDARQSCRPKLLDSFLLLLRDYYDMAVPMVVDFGVLLVEASMSSDATQSIQLLEYWTNKYPSGRDPEGNTLLHLVCKRPTLSISLLQKIMEHCPTVVDALNVSEGLFPIHYACMYNLSLDVVFTLGLHKPDRLGVFASVLVGPNSASDSSLGKAWVADKLTQNEQFQQPGKKQKIA